MEFFLKYSAKLSPHDEFDPGAFIGSSSVPQETCDFVLALALAHNDYKNYLIIFDMLLKSKPAGNPEKSPAWGEHAGIKFHIMRLHVGFVHELFKLLQENKKIMETPFFKEVIRCLNKKARKSWGDLVSSAFNEQAISKRSSPLFMIRNKMVFHYATKDLSAGYAKGFLKDGKILENACISQGTALESARFYFADKAVQGYLEKCLSADVEIFFKSLEQIMRDVNIALYNVCVLFIQKRGFSWKKP